MKDRFQTAICALAIFAIALSSDSRPAGAQDESAPLKVVASVPDLADVYIKLGLELEIGYEPLLLPNSRDARIAAGRPGHIDASAGIRALEIPPAGAGRELGDVHASGNPHYMVDPMEGLRVAGVIKEHLGDLRPAKRDYFET